MKFVPTLQKEILIVSTLLVFLIVCTKGQTCDIGWFGSQCQFKCHCTNNSCDEDGECVQGSKCEMGWFGLKCQYADLTTTEATASKPEWLFDADDSTCNDDPAAQYVQVVFKSPIRFTWMRMHMLDLTYFGDMSVGLRTSDGVTVPCTNLRAAQIANTTSDQYCDIEEPIQSIFFTGSGVKGICSLYINGGRSLALRASTSQSSTFSPHSNSSLAVDGNTDGDWNHESCSRTDSTTNLASWNVKLPRQSTIDRIVIYNRIDASSEYLKNFILTVSTLYADLVFRYQDLQVNAQDKYSVINTNATTVASIVNIQATYKNPDNQTSGLSLCEVEVYGETICPVSRYGGDCEYTCRYTDTNGRCLRATGGLYGCLPGYDGQFCNEECPPTFYGFACEEQCSTNCVEQLCDRFNGTCDQCPPGKMGDHCDEDLGLDSPKRGHWFKYCPPKTYGSLCQRDCSKDCVNQLCDSGDGTCLQCPTGKTGSLCDQECPPKTYGSTCQQECSTNCLDQVCDSVNGTCLQCPSGKNGDLCDQDCPLKTHGSFCQQPCSTNCVDQLCDSVDGSCLQCPPGKMGEYCDQDCPPKTYGPSCRQACSTNCVDQLCDRVNGSCLQCPAGKMGDYCDQESPRKPVDQSDESSNQLVLIIGIGCGKAVIVVIAVVIGVVCYRQRSRNKAASPPISPRTEIDYITPRDGIGTVDHFNFTNGAENYYSSYRRSPYQSNVSDTEYDFIGDDYFTVVDHYDRPYDQSASSSQ